MLSKSVSSVKSVDCLVTDNLDSIIDAPDGIKRLRELILQLAVQGKLVEQRPEEGTANELLRQIKEAKRKDAEARKARGERVRKQKPLQTIEKSEIPYEIPKDWKWVRLGDIGELGRGKSKHRPRNDPSLYSGGSYPMVQTGDVARARDIIKTHTALYNRKGVEQSKLWPKGTLCITIAANIGDTGILGFDACFPDSVVGFVPTEPMNAIRFFQTVMRTRQKFLEDQAPATAQKNINLAILEVIPVALPPLAEQKRIVAKVDQLMVWCDELDMLKQKRDTLQRAALKATLRDLVGKAVPAVRTHAMPTEPSPPNGALGQHALPLTRLGPIFSALIRDPADVKQLRDAILQLAVQGRLVPQHKEDGTAADLLTQIEKAKRKDAEERKARGERIRKPKPLPPIEKDEIPFDIPKGWKWVRIRSVFSDVGQKIPDQKFCYIDVSAINKERGIVTSDDVKVLTAANAPSRARKLVCKGSVIYSTVRPYLLNIAVIEDDFKYEPIVSTAFAVLRPWADTSIQLLYYYLRSPCFTDYVESKQKGVAYPAISESEFNVGLYPLPPLAEQQRIVKKVDELMATCDELETLLRTASTTATRFAAAIAKI